MLVPRLPQTHEYAETLIRNEAAADIPEEQIGKMIEVRMTRQQMLGREQSASFTAVVDESVLRRVIGSPEVMRGQLARLREIAERPNIKLRVLPLRPPRRVRLPGQVHCLLARAGAKNLNQVGHPGFRLRVVANLRLGVGDSTMGVMALEFTGGDPFIRDDASDFRRSQAMSAWSTVRVPSRSSAVSASNRAELRAGVVEHKSVQRTQPLDGLRDTAVRTLYEWGDVVPRKVSADLLNAIPEGPSLTLPDIPPGQPSSLLPGVQVGEVVRVKGAMQQSYFLLLPQGKQQVERAVADLIRYHRRAARPLARTARRRPSDRRGPGHQDPGRAVHRGAGAQPAPSRHGADRAPAGATEMLAPPWTGPADPDRAVPAVVQGEDSGHSTAHPRRQPTPRRAAQAVHPTRVQVRHDRH